MHKWSALFLLTTELLWAQAPNTAGRLADLEFVGTQLPKLCLNFYSQVSPTAYAAAVAALRAQITNLTDAEFYVGLAKLAAMAGDDHTFVRLDDVAAVHAGFQIFPLRFDWMGDGLFVVQASAPYSQAKDKDPTTSAVLGVAVWRRFVALRASGERRSFQLQYQCRRSLRTVCNPTTNCSRLRPGKREYRSVPAETGEGRIFNSDSRNARCSTTAALRPTHPLAMSYS